MPSIQNVGFLGKLGVLAVVGLLTAGGVFAGLGIGGVPSDSGQSGVESNTSASPSGATGGSPDADSTSTANPSTATATPEQTPTDAPTETPDSTTTATDGGPTASSGGGGGGGGGGGASSAEDSTTTPTATSTPTETDDGESSPTTGTTLAAESASVAPGETASVDLVLERAPDGMAGFRTTLTLDADVATIESASVATDVQRYAWVTVADDESSVRIETIDDEEVVQPGATDVRLATLTIEGASAGSTSLDLTVEQFDDDSGSGVDAEANDGTIDVGGS